MNQLFFSRQPHFSKFILILLSVRTQLTSDNKFFKKITSKCLFSILKGSTLSLSKITYIDWRIGGLSCDINEDFEQLDDEFLQIAGIDTRSFSDKCIVLKLILILNSGNNDLIDVSLLLEEEYDDCIE